MSFDTRNNSAMSKRAEQLKRWEESETNREPTVPKNINGRKIKFSSGCVFLAACMSGDKEEVVRLLDNGADIDTANVDGLTALHQACIDDNLEMVEFLVSRGADVNRQDNEGWTPLHATASCGFLSIARYLIENGADLAAVSSDGELVIDLAESNQMEHLLQKYINEKGIDCNEARQSEEILMLSDAKNWLRSDASEADKPHPRTGATALHVAAAKGYIKVLNLLLATRADVDKQDNDGWTPLHAAAHWGQKEAAQMLVAALADIEIKNYSGQTPLDVADSSITYFLQDLKKNKRSKRRPASQIRISDSMDNHIETPSKVIRVDLKSEQKDPDDEKPKPPPSEPVASIPKDSNSIEEDTPWRRSQRNRSQQDSPPKNHVPDKETESSESEIILRRTQSFENDEKFYKKYRELRERIKANSYPVLSDTPICGGNVTGNINNTTNNYQVQRSASLKDHRQLRKTANLPTIIGSPSAPVSTTIINTTPPTSGQVRRSFVPPVRDEESETQRKAHAKRVRETRRSTQGVTLDEIKSAEELVKKKNMTNNNSTATTNNSDTSTTTATTSTISISTTTATINDRVPLQKSSDVNTTISSGQSINSSSVSADHITADHITATYTLSTPPSINSKDDDKISASYTISSSTVVPSSKVDPIRNHHQSDNSTITATINVSNNNNNINNNNSNIDNNKKNISNNNTNKTDLEELTKTASPTIVQTNFRINEKIKKLNNELSISNNEIEKRNTNELSSPTSPVNLSSGVSLTGTSATATTTTTTTTTVVSTTNVAPPTVDYTFNRVSARHEKRSLFDIDNASSLSLADKLRNEANKYSSETGNQNNENLDNTKKNETDTTNENIPKSQLSQNQQQQQQTTTGTQHTTTVTTERRPSWRLKFDAGSKFKLEEISLPVATTTTTTTVNNSINTTSNTTGISSITQRRNNLQNTNPSTTTATTTTINTRPISAPIITATTTSDTTTITSSNERVKDEVVTLPLRRQLRNDEENDKDNENRSVQATQAVIQRRRRPKRRSTGVVHVDMDDIDPERQESSIDGDEKESGSERTSRSRLGSTSSQSSEQNDATKSSTTTTQISDSLPLSTLSLSSAENGEILDYKALYEAAKIDNDKLKLQLKKKDDELISAKATVDRFTNATTKNSLSELEKRERRAMERKLSEMEEELKQLDALKTENQRLKDENGALIRVISKLSK